MQDDNSDPTADVEATAAISRRHLLGVALLLAGAGLMPRRALAESAIQEDPILAGGAARGEVYLLRGFADVFSRGLDEMGVQLRARGINAQVQGHLGWRGIARQIIADFRRQGRAPVVLVGHSLGANAVISIAERLEAEGIVVNYMATFAATAPDPLPGNIRRVVNFYFATNGWGRPLVAGPRFSGSLRNRDFSNAGSVGHFNIDKQRPLQAEVVRDVLRTLL